jgi:signal transduction histidine kinase
MLINDPALAGDSSFWLAMHDAREPRERANPREGWGMGSRRRRDSRHHDQQSGDEPRDPRRGGKRRARLTPEEKIYRQARTRANHRIGWTIHLITCASTLALILFATRSIRVAIIVGLGWGILLSIHYFAALVAPGLRQRWIEDEVGRQVSHGVSRLDEAETASARSLEGLSASIAHEIRNPITAAKSLVQQMGEDPVSNENVEFARVALDELDRVERSISHLLRYAREEGFAFDEVALPEIIDSSIAAMSDRADSLGVAIERDYEETCVMRGDHEKLRRVILNLLSNAFDAIEDSHVRDPKVEISAGQNLAGSEVWMRVRDNGPGLDAAAGDRIFDPFYTTKESGTGLGLALSKKIVEAHGGSFEASSAHEGGAEFVLRFPKSVLRPEETA